MSASAEFDTIAARLDDLCRKADRGEVGVSDFLTPKDLKLAKKHLDRCGIKHLVFGGYEDAERARIYVLPEYLESLEAVEDIEEYGFSTDTRAVLISTDGYRQLSHRDYLGSILGMGVERDVIGDVLVLEDGGKSALVLCTEAISTYLCSELCRISTEKARVRRVRIDEVQIPERKMMPISDTVASPRLDCIVGALCSLSREKARATVESGLVELDFEREERPDRTVSAPCIISVRGYGRFRINSVSDMTKKGRYRLNAEKFV
jgi:RNA-binding protein YlmH